MSPRALSEAGVDVTHVVLKGKAKLFEEGDVLRTGEQLGVHMSHLSALRERIESLPT